VVTGMSRSRHEIHADQRAGQQRLTTPRHRWTGGLPQQIRRRRCRGRHRRSSILEIIGLGGMAVAAAPTVAAFVGGDFGDAIAATDEMREIVVAAHPTFTLPALGFAGTPAGIDVLRVVETGIVPFIDTGAVHELDPDVGQIGAGIAHAPLEVFRSALVALGGTLRIVGPGGTRTVPVEAFHVLPSVDYRRETVLEPGEIVAEVVVPPPAPGLRSTYRKVRARASWDFALVGAAFALRLAGDVVREARVAFSGVAPVPWRAKAVEAALTGRRLDAGTIRNAAAAAVKGASPLAHNGYKVPLLRGLVEERLEAIAKG
jgi:hypothetical protein